MPKPPPYDDKTSGPQGRRKECHLILRLQVWHSTPRGRCTEYNAELARRFARRVMRQWTVSPGGFDESNDASFKANFVPVEVEFQSCDSCPGDQRGNAGSAVRDLFSDIAPQCIHEYFRDIGSIPHVMNMYPIQAPNRWKKRYNFACVLNQMHLGTQSPVVQGVISRQQPVVPGVKSEQPSKPFTLKRLQAWVKGLHNEVYEFADANVRPANIETAWGRVCQPLGEYHGILKRNGLDTLSKGKSWSDQDLYDLVRNMHSGALRFSRIEREMKHLEDLLLEKYKEDNRRPRTMRNSGLGMGAIGIIALAATCWWNPAGWIAMTCAYGTEALVTVGGGVIAKSGRNGIDNIEAKKKAVRKARDAARDVRNSYRDARVAVAALFCHQVLQMPVKSLERHEREEILADLGVDLDALENSEEYREEFVIDRLRKLWHDQQELYNSVKRLGNDNQLEWEI